MLLCFMFFSLIGKVLIEDNQFIAPIVSNHTSTWILQPTCDKVSMKMKKK